MSRRKPKGRPVSGILLLDKPTQITSNAALQVVKRLFKAQKAGHTGSLDPLASGMLPICLGQATKFSQYLLNADKTYVVTAKLGIKTATGDAEGEVIAERPIPEIAEKQLEAVLENFRGDIQQVPSMYSAIKHKGQPLYKLARQGIEVERPSREVTVFELKLLKQAESEIELYVHCSKGTYVRTLVEDIGEQLTCGAHVTALRRLDVGPYKASEMRSLESLKALAESGFSELDKVLLPLSTSVSHWEQVKLSEAAAFYLRQGQPVIVPRAPSEGWVSLLLGENRFLGVGEVLDDGRVAPRRLVVSEAHSN